MDTEKQIQEEKIESTTICSSSEIVSNGQNQIVNNEPNQNVVKIIVKEEKSNGIGTAGFVLSIVSLALCWIPFLSWILWTLGSIFSFIGVFKRPRALAIAGLIISAVCFLIFYVAIAIIAGDILFEESIYY